MTNVSSVVELNLLKLSQNKLYSFILSNILTIIFVCESVDDGKTLSMTTLIIMEYTSALNNYNHY